jgi:hypothetical protein
MTTDTPRTDSCPWSDPLSATFIPDHDTTNEVAPTPITMNPQEINKRIAIACGWKIHPKDRFIVTHPNYPHSVQPLSTIPNYHGDFNAMHEAEIQLSIDQKVDMEHELIKLTGSTFLLWRATAAQRAEAFLRTIGQWEDEK